MNKSKSGSSIVGASSLIAIFAVLCLTIFAVLSLSTAYAGKRLSDKSAASVSEYYQAEINAEETLYKLINKETPEKDGVYSFVSTISDTLELHVTVKLEGNSYTILRWQTVSVTEWTPDDGIDVWDGQPS